MQKYVSDFWFPNHHTFPLRMHALLSLGPFVASGVHLQSWPSLWRKMSSRMLGCVFASWGNMTCRRHGPRVRNWTALKAQRDQRLCLPLCLEVHWPDWPLPCCYHCWLEFFNHCNSCWLGRSDVGFAYTICDSWWSSYFFTMIFFLLLSFLI